MSKISLASYKALGISGPIASGKTTLARRLASHLGARHVHFGTLVKSVAGQRNLPLHRTTLQNLGEVLVNELGPQQFIEEAVISSQVDGNGPLIFDGVRHLSIWEAITQLTKQAFLIYLQIPKEVCIQRLIERDNISPSDAYSTMEHLQEVGVLNLEKVANLVVSVPFGDTEWREVLATLENFLVDRG